MNRAAFATLGLLLLAGCASVDPKPSFDSVADIVTARSGVEAAWPRTATEEDAAEQAAERLLAGPLDDRAAAQIALLRNRELLAEIEDLGIARADYAQATRIANPGLHAFDARRTKAPARMSSGRSSRTSSTSSCSRPASGWPRSSPRSREAPARTDDAGPRRRSADRFLRARRRRGDLRSRGDRARPDGSGGRAGAPAARRREPRSAPKSLCSRPPMPRPWWTSRRRSSTRERRASG